MIVLLTGGTGYVGRHVAAGCLARGWQVHLLTRVDSVVPTSLAGRVVQHRSDGTLGSLAAVMAAVGPAVVIHLASATAGPYDPGRMERLLEGNVLYPTRLVEAMRQAAVGRLVNTGTFWQHYRGAHYHPVDFYAATKQAFEDLLAHFTDAHGFAAVTLKLFDNYGPADPRGKIVTALVAAAREGRALALSPGEQVLDLTHVEDLAEAFVIAADLAAAAPAGRQRTYFAGGERLTLRALVALIAERCPDGFRPEMGARAYREREVMVPVAVGEAALPGWHRRHDLATTIDALLRGD